MACGCEKKRAAQRAAGESTPPPPAPRARSTSEKAPLSIRVTNGDETKDRTFGSVIAARNYARSLSGTVRILRS